MAQSSLPIAADSGDTPRDGGATLRWLALGLLPLLLLALVLALIVATNAGLADRTVPPIETLNVQRVTLPAPGSIQMRVINDGPDPITIAQVMVDDAFYVYGMEPARTLRRLESATITIPYPWVEGEAHKIGLLTRNGILFEAQVPVALQAPATDAAAFARFALIGTYVGVVPVALGLLWFPFMRRLGRRGLDFILSLTIGLLVFLVVDMFGEASKTALRAPGALKGPLLVPIIALLSFLLLLTISGRKSREPQSGLAVSSRIALGIGLHNLGEGLAIGAAFALGEIALGVFLILGFTLHNVTEGIGIAAPLVREHPRLIHFAGLAALAGLPAILGTWIGAFVYSPFWATIFLAVGIGAIAQVIVEVSRLITRGAARREEPALNWMTLGGVAAGIAIMYATALLVA